jgi:hypothetical protein
MTVARTALMSVWTRAKCLSLGSSESGTNKATKPRMAGVKMIQVRSVEVVSIALS